MAWLEADSEASVLSGTPDGCQLYLRMTLNKLSEITQEVTWRLLLVVHLKLNGLADYYLCVLFVFCLPCRDTSSLHRWREGMQMPMHIT